MSRFPKALLDDHANLERLFREVENAVEGADYPTIQRVWDEFERNLMSHLDAEEIYLLPLLEKTHGEDVRRVRAEHERIRSLIADLGIRTDLHTLCKNVADALVELLREHAAGEERTTYRYASEVTTEERRRALFDFLHTKRAAS